MSNLVLLHLLSAFASLILLMIRGWIQLGGRDWRAVKPLRILPHLADTLLVVSGIALIFAFHLNLQLWLIGKVVLLIMYVFFAAKYFHKSARQPSALYLFLALAVFLGAIGLGYWH